MYRGATAEELQQWLASYFRHLEETLHSDLIDPYAVVDGSIIGATFWTEDASYDYIDTEWYQKALDADGEIIFTDSYQDAITGLEERFRKKLPVRLVLFGDSISCGYDVVPQIK